MVSTSQQQEAEKHYINRSGWLRAAVLGANDGILSTASIAIGVAAASDAIEPVVLASLAGLVAGALSMAAGEYVSVSSQADIETADLAREQFELDTMPEVELQELAATFVQRGLTPVTALEVARQLSAHNALEAHAREELGIQEITQARPLQAAFASGASFTVGGALPFLVVLLLPLNYQVVGQYLFATLFLMILGAVSARAGGSNVLNAVVRITFWGTVAMGVTALVGYMFNQQMG